MAFTTKDASDYLVDGLDNALRVKLGYDSTGNTLRFGLIGATRQGNAEYLAALNTANGGDMVDGDGAVIPGTAFNSMSGLLKGKWLLGQDGDQDLTFSMSRTDSDLDDTTVAQTGGAVASAFGTADVPIIDDTLSLTWHDAMAQSLFWDVTAQLSHTSTMAEKQDFSLAMYCSPGQFSVPCDSSYGYSTTAIRLENTADLSSGLWQNFLITGVQLTAQDRTADSSVGDLAFHPEGTDNTLGVYMQGEFVWNDTLPLIPGIRVDSSTITPGVGAKLAGARAIGHCVFAQTGGNVSIDGVSFDFWHIGADRVDADLGRALLFGSGSHVAGASAQPQPAEGRGNNHGAWLGLAIPGGAARR